MSGILKLVLSKKSIYERSKIYRDIVHEGFLITEKIPILYKTDFKQKFLKILKQDKIENESFNGNFGVIYLFINELEYINEINNEFGNNIYFDFSYKIKFDDINSNFNSCVTSLNNSTGLSGEGVVIAFVDTGIDYTLNAFRNDDGTTRIKYMYDANTDELYTSEKINSALKSENPFDLIKENDLKGHGTAVTSIACAGGNIERNLFGVAPKSEIISVNVTTAIDSLETLFHTIIKAFDFLLKKQKEEKFPLVVNLSFSTNFGAHTGKSLLEEYVEDFASNKNISVVVSAGNEGGVGHHKSGKITLKGEEINLEISGSHKSVPISLYKDVLSDLFIKIISPKSGSSQKIKILEGIQNLRLGGDNITILFTGPTNYDVSGDIEIIISSGSNEHIEEGIWTIEITLANEYETSYNMWTPITESIGKKTRFLDPDNNNTLGSPATVSNVISVGSYNYRTETVSLFSGRGSLNDLNIKPDILAPGEDVRVIYPHGRIATVSGTSFSAPVVSGICALLMEWGILKKNKENLYGEVIKYFLIRGATRVKNINYPNNSYGYGFVCASKSFGDITESINNILDLIKNESSVLNNNREEINLSKFDNLKMKICPLNVFNDSNRVQFLANVNKNINNIGDDVCLYPLEYKTDNEFIAVISVPIDKIDEFEKSYFSNENISIQKSYYYALCSEGISPMTDSGIYQTQNNEYLNLTGRGVIVGIIDTGIDYLHEEFMDALGESRILEIWDQTIEGDYGNENLFGTIYTREQINSAIKLKNNGGDPYSIVPSRDTVGHGTAMAGITSASGYGAVRGGAPDSDLVIVKLKEISNEFKEYLDFDTTNDMPIYDEVSIHLALRYLKKVKSKYNKPMVVLIPLQTNGGDHSGNTILENQINDYSENLGFIVVVPSGNQANKQIHATGIIQKTGEEGLMEVFADKGQRKLRINLYVENFARASIIIVSPSGEKTHKFKLNFGKIYDFKFLFEETTIKILCEIEENSISILQYIGILFDNLKTGIWQIILVSEDEQILKYDAYLTLKEFLRPETKFLNSNSNNTVTSPATARLAVSMAYFNQNYSSIVAESGQGYTLDGRVSPILAAGGIDVITTGRGGKEYLISGSSVAVAVAVGGIALILEWGIVKKNKVQLNSAVIIWLLVSAATNPKGYDFPNKYWGYGILNIRNVFEMLR